MASGTSALSLGIALALKSRPETAKAEVILPSYGCPDLVSAVLAQGAQPILVDISKADPRLDLDGVEKAITRHTAGIVAVSFLGIPERLDALKAIADKANAWLIEDSAQAFPPISAASGTADCVVLSFGRGKPINLMGGGALLVRNDHADAAQHVIDACKQITISAGPAWFIRRWLFNMLLTRPLYGLAERMPFLGIGETVFHPLHTVSRQIPVNGLVEAGAAAHGDRPYLGGYYQDALAGLVEKGWSFPAAVITDTEDKGTSSKGKRLLRLPVLAPSKQVRDKALSALNRAGIGANAFYGAPLPLIRGLEGWFDAAAFPNACDFADRLITLPIHEDVTRTDIDRVADILLRHHFAS